MRWLCMKRSACGKYSKNLQAYDSDEIKYGGILWLVRQEQQQFIFFRTLSDGE
jgi:hypothetical protein